jgi:hypothetical protein
MDADDCYIAEALNEDEAEWLAAAINVYPELAALRERERVLAGALERLTNMPRYADDHGVIVCAYCHEPLRNAHAKDCPWLLARRALSPTEPPEASE